VAELGELGKILVDTAEREWARVSPGLFEAFARLACGLVSQGAAE